MSGEATRDDLVVTGRERERDAGDVHRGACYGDYIILERIGRGAMGQVFRALHPQLAREVALKLIALPSADNPRRIAGLRVLREGRALARLRHPNVVTVHDVGEAECYAYVAMELVEGSTLRAWAATPRSTTDILATLVSAGRGLAAAHRAGLVHRDFKPDNVLVSTHGEVRVTDFGLARLAGDPSHSVEPLRAMVATDETLSRPGTPIGTLAYMAPEILDGNQATRASDQFSFCVTAFECLYGRRPFDGSTPDELRANIAAGRIWRAPATARGTRTHRLLVRGLAALPGARHPSLVGLLDALEPVWRRRIPWLVALASFGAAAGVLASSTTHSGAIDPAPCDDSARWDGSWDDARKAEIHRAFAATKLPYAEQAFDQVRAAIDHYTQTWSERQRQRCVIASAGESATSYELACLRQRRDEVDQLVTTLAHADAAVVPKAARMTVALRAPSLCELTSPDDAAATMRPLVDPHGDAKLHDRFAAARLAHDTGDLATAERVGREVIAGATGDIALVTEARVLVGTIEVERHREGDDETTLFSAAVDAEAAGLYVLAAEAWLELAVATLDRPQGLAPRWISLADVAVTRAGNPPDLAAMLASRRARLAMQRGDFSGALALQQQASKLLAATYGDGDLRVAASNFHLATSLGMVGRCREAVPLLREVVAIRTRALSPAHPDTLDADETLAICLDKTERSAEALPILERTLAAREVLLGHDSPALAGALNNLAGALANLHRVDEAIALWKRSVALREAAYGPTDDRVARPLLNLGGILVELDRASEALPLLRRARDIFEAAGGSGLLNGGYARLHIAEMLARLHRYDDAFAELAPIEHIPASQYAVIAGRAQIARSKLMLALVRR